MNSNRLVLCATGRLNVGYLQDLLLNSIFCNLPLCILLVPWQVTLVHQPVEVISYFVGDGKPLGKQQPVSFTWMFLQNS